MLQGPVFSASPPVPPVPIRDSGLSGGTDPDRKAPPESLSNTKNNVAKKIGAAPPAAPILPAADCPVLIGVDQIAAWLGISRGRCRGLVDDGAVPTFRLPGRSMRCALKSAIGAAMAEYAKSPPRKRKATAEDPA